jgi:hypothetical protein
MVRTSTPVAVWVSIATGLAATIWIDVFEPTTNPHLTVESTQSWSWILVGAATIAGTILGVRLFWGLWLFGVAIGAVFTVSTLVQDGLTVQLVGGTILSVASVVFILLPSATLFENKRLRLNVEDPDDPDHLGPVPLWLLLLAVVLMVLVGFIIAD